MQKHKILAMWSGPRNISTAMMRAWENRTDCAVMDEPFYGSYLKDTGLDHPMREEILEHCETDWQRAIEQCLTAPKGGSAISYQKHMTHHMLPLYERDWMREVDHCFLLRNPEWVLKSYALKREQVNIYDIGLPQQLDIYDWVCERLGTEPLVIDSADFLQQPEGYLSAICDRLGVAFDNNMLSWPAGRRDSDGVWSEHWYNKVWQSTHFNPPAPANNDPLDESLMPVLKEALPQYEYLYERRLQLS